MKDNLNKLSSNTLLVPFAKMNSVSRLDMAGSAFKHLVIPTKPEYPLVDSCYTNDILLSSDNIKEDKGIKMIKKIEKTINGVVSETTYFYQSLKDDMIKVVKVPKYNICYEFGYPMTSELSNMKPGEVKKDPTYVIHHEFYDVENKIVSFGKNVNIIYNISRDVGEDSIVVTESLANKFSKLHIKEVEFLISPDHILRNIYGDKDNYKPLPLPGDTIKDGIISIMYIDESKVFLAYDDSQDLESDTKILIQYANAYVYDMEVYSKEPITNLPHLEEMRQNYRDYMRTIIDTAYAVTKEYGEDKIHHTINNMVNKYSAILNNSSMYWGVGTELKTNIGIKYKLVFDKPLEVGDKLTNRHGGKGTISAVVPDFIKAVDDDGDVTNVDMMVNLTGVINRENVAQLYERELNTNWRFIQKYLNKSNDDNKRKKEVLLTWLSKAKQETSMNELMNIDENTLVEYYKVNDMVLTYPPYDDPDKSEQMNFDIFTDMVNYTNSIYKVEPSTIYYDNKVFSEKHHVGKAFYLVLANGPFKATSIRGDDGTNSKGASTKIGKDRKKFSTKYGSTAVRKSDLAINITINSLFNKDKSILRNNSKPVHDLLHIMGRDLIFEEKDLDDINLDFEFEDNVEENNEEVEVKEEEVIDD